MRKIAFTFFILLLFLAAYDQFFLKKDAQEQGRVEQQEDQPASTSSQPDYGLKLGQRAPDFTLETLSGDQFVLKDLRGKTVLLNFWATWCPPCREEMPHMQKVYEQYHNRDVEIVAVNLTFGKETVEKAEAFAEEFGLSFPIPLDVTGEVADLYQIIPIPTTYFIDKDGVIRSKYFGPMTEEYMITQIEHLDG